MHRLILPTHSFITRLHLNILLSCIVSANLADTPIWGIIGTPADTPSNLTFNLSPCQSTDQIDWHAWSIFRAWRTIALGFQCVDFCVNNSYMMQLLQSCITASIWVWFASLDVENSHVCAAARIWMKRQFWILPVHGRQGTCVLVLARIPNKQLLGILRCRRLAAESVGISLAASCSRWLLHHPCASLPTVQTVRQGDRRLSG